MQSEESSAGVMHHFHTIAFEENPPLRQLSRALPALGLGRMKIYSPIEPTGRHLRM